ncbi:hypothetical protein J6TS7_32400 [Paenibacillus dendritiformis]|uniref:hypothetical protein n=1 Tax=Paenibacillus TaxID=44249 RepID=UPI001B147532|nr:hypothetical protein [Paenibacillus dendritiformis]GIO79630.1 hypothetical protein J6TS7_32400 [Paenibacillus dendritiformis]
MNQERELQEDKTGHRRRGRADRQCGLLRINQERELQEDKTGHRRRGRADRQCGLLRINQEHELLLCRYPTTLKAGKSPSL